MSDQLQPTVNPDDFPVEGDVKGLFSTIVMTKNQLTQSTDFINDLITTMGPKPRKDELEMLATMQEQIVKLLKRTSDSTSAEPVSAELHRTLSKNQQTLSKFLGQYSKLNEGFDAVTKNVMKVEKDLQESIEDLLKTDKGRAISVAYENMLIFFFSKHNMLESSSGGPKNVIQTFDATFQEMIDLYIGTTAFRVSRTKICLLCYKIFTVLDIKSHKNEQYCLPQCNHPAMLPLSLIAKTSLRKDGFPLPVSLLDVMHYIHSIKDQLKDFKIYDILDHPDNQEELTYLPLPIIWSFQCQELVSSNKMKPGGKSYAHRCLNPSSKLYRIDMSKPENLLHDWPNFMNQGNYQSTKYTLEWFQEIDRYLKGDHPKAVDKLKIFSKDRSKSAISLSHPNSRTEDPKCKAELAILKKMDSENKLAKVEIPKETFKIIMVTDGVTTQYHAHGKSIQIYLIPKDNHKEFKEEFEKEFNEQKRLVYGRAPLTTTESMSKLLNLSQNQHPKEGPHNPATASSMPAINQNSPTQTGVPSTYRALPSGQSFQAFLDRSQKRAKESAPITPLNPRQERKDSSASERSQSPSVAKTTLGQHFDSQEINRKNRKQNINLNLKQLSSTVPENTGKSTAKLDHTSFMKDIEYASSNINAERNLANPIERSQLQTSGRIH